MTWQKLKKDDFEKFKVYREQYKTRYRMKTGSGIYLKRSYTKEEDDLILEHAISDRELSVKLKRSVLAIQIRRSRLKAERKEEHG